MSFKWSTTGIPEQIHSACLLSISANVAHKFSSIGPEFVCAIQ